MALSNFWCCLVQHQNIHTPFNQFLFLLLPLYAKSVSFNFSTFQPDYVNITFQGEAYPIPNALQLTKDTNYGSLNYSAGRASYHEAVQLWVNSEGRLTLTDFTTHFSFVINAINMSKSGDGLSFFIAPFDSKMPEKSAGGFLGLFSVESAINASRNQIVAVEFDSFKNPWDPSDDHVGTNVNSIVSKANVP
ncbi:agglutinin-2 [Quercus suber]|uniref:Agglutinin-2 n=1 Tax=Quercus suber TaxID=58331 RepID=A0AAW0LVD4_QUESU|nr:agglutinin-2 [Quercus suber]